MKFLGVAALGILVSASCRSAPPPPEGPANLLLITLDTLRADRLGSYGYREASTPNLDRLAGQGARFTQAISPVPLTLPAHTTILTGLFPMGHQVRDNGTFQLSSGDTTLAEVLSERGWDTAAFVSSFVVDSRFGLGQGFEVYDDFDEEEGASERALRGLSQVQRVGGETAARAREWLKRSREAPFFLWLHLYDPHSPFEAPEPFGSRFSDRPYDGEVAYTDAVVGEVLAELDALGLVEETLVVVAGDHGESLGEHGEAYHSWFVYDATLKVPLLIRWPGRIAPGTVIEEQVRLADVAPTVLELLGIPGEARAEMQGVSVLPLLDGDEVPSLASLPAYAESLVANLQFGWGELKALRDEGYKYIEAPRPELYDLSRDPNETENLIGSRAATARRLRERLRAMESELTRGKDEGSRASALDAETARKLQSLGYLAAPRVGSESDDLGVDPKDRIDVYREFSVAISEAMAAMDGGAPARAVQLLEPLARKVPTHSLVHFHLGEAHLERGDVRSGIAELDLTLDLAPGFAQARADLAQALVRSGRASEAMALLEEGLEQQPGNPLFLFNLGFAHHAERDFEGALEAYREFRSLEGHHPKVLSNLAALYLQTDRAARAVEALESLVSRVPDDAMAWNNLGLARAQAGRLEAAGEAFEHAVALAPENIPLRKNLLLWYQRMGRHREAQEQLERLRVLERS